MRRYSPRDWVVLILIGLAVLYWLDPRILRGGAGLDQVAEDLIARLVVLAVSITVHEFGHAAVAYWLGDGTPKEQGRVSLNPIRHLDPFGTLMILFGPIGWGKPVMWNPARIKKTSVRVAMIAVSLAGITMNLLLAALLVQVVRLPDFDAPRNVEQALVRMIGLNIGLAAFNILPIPPLDGYNFWLGVLPPPLARLLYPLNQYGFLILILLIFLPSLGGPNVLSLLVGPVQRAFTQLVTGGFT